MIVETTAGPVRFASDGSVRRVRGVPVAHTRRFRAPEPVERWRDVREDTPDPPLSPQHETPFDPGGLGRVVGDESACVHASVWAPDGAVDLPVVVWLHGGGGFAGSSTCYDASALAADLDAVVVSLSFRVGALGFLQVADLLGDGFADAGSAGLLDIRAGLEWTRREIGAFGGDPDRIVVAGQSAGAALVTCVLATEWGRASVRGAIVQSGTAERVHPAGEAAAVAEQLAARLGGAPRLLHAPVSELIDAQGELLAERRRVAATLPTPFRPVLGVGGVAEVPLRTAARWPDLLIGTNLRECENTAAVLPGAPAACAAAGPGYRAAVDAVAARGWPVGDPVAAWCTDASYRQPTERVVTARTEAGRRGASDAATYAYLFVGVDGAPPVHTAELDLLFSTSARVREQGAVLRGVWADFVHERLDPRLRVGEDRTTIVLDERVSAVRDPLAPLRAAFRAS